MSRRALFPSKISVDPYELTGLVSLRHLLHIKRGMYIMVKHLIKIGKIQMSSNTV
jgi:hypothetical protein